MTSINLIKPCEDLDFEYVDCEAFTKPVVRVLSGVSQPIAPFTVVPNPLVGFDTVVPQLRELVKCAHEFNEPNFITPEQFEDSPLRSSFHDLVHSFKTILNYDYIPLPMREKQSEISKAFASPLISFLNAEFRTARPGYSVLVLGAREGKDLRRLEIANPSFGTVVCVDPDKKSLHSLKRTFPNAKCYVGTVSRHLKTLQHDGPFDLIIANMSFHYIFGVDSGARVAKALPTLLSDNGVFFGSFVDVASVKASGMSQFLKTGHSVMYMGERPHDLVNGERATNGVAMVSMAGIIWEDPYIDVDQIYQLFEQVPLSLNIYDGHTMVIGPKDGAPLYQPPPAFAFQVRRPELAMYRCAIMSKYHHPTLTPLHQPTHHLRVVRSTGLADRHFSTPHNKGLPLLPYESQYITHSHCWLAVKRDGFAGTLAYSQKGLELFVPHLNKSFKYKNFTGEYFHDFVLQVEVMSSSSEDCHIDLDETKMWVVVLDVLVAPWGISGSFVARWRWLESIYTDSKKHILWPFFLQEWAVLGSQRSLRMILDAKEGVVCQSLTAPPSAIKDGAGSARYVKRLYTKDVRDAGGKIIECTLDGKFVRDRPDKKFANPKVVVDRLNEALDYRVFTLYVFSKYYATLTADWRSLMKKIVERQPPAVWDKADIVLFYFNRHNEIFRSMAPELMRVLELQVCAKLSHDAPQPIPPTPDVIHMDDVHFEDFDDPHLIKKEDIPTIDYLVHVPRSFPIVERDMWPHEWNAFLSTDVGFDVLTSLVNQLN